MQRMYWTLAVWDGQVQQYPHHGYGFESFAIRLGCPHHDQKLVGTTAEKQTEGVLSRACHGFQPIVPNIWMRLVGIIPRYLETTILTQTFGWICSVWICSLWVTSVTGDSQGQVWTPTADQVVHSPGSKWFTALAARVVTTSWGYYPLLHLAYHF